MYTSSLSVRKTDRRSHNHDTYMLIPQVDRDMPGNAFLRHRVTQQRTGTAKIRRTLTQSVSEVSRPLLVRYGVQVVLDAGQHERT